MAQSPTMLVYSSLPGVYRVFVGVCRLEDCRVSLDWPGISEKAGTVETEDGRATRATHGLPLVFTQLADRPFESRIRYVCLSVWLSVVPSPNLLSQVCVYVCLCLSVCALDNMFQ